MKWKSHSLSTFLTSASVLLIIFSSLRQQPVSGLSSHHPIKMSLYRQTPLIKSPQLSSLVGKDVYLKLDALQPSGSFKDRGMAHLCQTLQAKGVTQLISSSGGNAGLAVATVAKNLNMNVQVVVPQTTKTLVVEKLKSLGADVTIHGENWNTADALARQRVADSNGAAEYVSPYDNPLLWTGHSTVVKEIMEELPDVGCIVVSVGGGGLLCGVLEGLADTTSGGSNSHIKVIATETEGASSFGQAFQKGEVVTLPGITSVATSLGATSVTPVALERSKNHGNVASAIFTDSEAVEACLSLAQDHRLLVEPACGAALSVVYSPRLRAEYLQDIKGPIVIEVCGGSGVNVSLLQEWKEQFGVSI